MLAHTFRGSSWRSAIGLEKSRTVFQRYKAIRRVERNYLDPQTTSGPQPSNRIAAAAGV